MRRSDLPLAIQALEAAGYTYHEVMQVTCFLEEPDDLPSDSVHILWANEKVRGEYVLPIQTLLIRYNLVKSESSNSKIGLDETELLSDQRSNSFTRFTRRWSH